METALLVAVLVGAAAACPVMALIGRRRGRAMGCCPAPRAQADELERLRAERAEVEERIVAAERAEETSR